MSFDSPATAAALGLGDPSLLGGDHVEDLHDLRPITRDDDKLKKLETILDILNVSGDLWSDLSATADMQQKKKGLVSEAGLERLARRHGLDCLPEDYTGPNGRKMRAVIIAGSSTQIDIVLDNNIVQNVTLAFPESSESTTKYMEPASEILLHDLRLPPNQSPLTKTLDKFAYNLERLAILDKLSVLPAFDCRAALAGLYNSLHGLHEWTLAQLKEEADSNGAMDFMTVMCQKHGLPVMHARNRIGLAIQYWKEGRLIPPTIEGIPSFSDDEKIWSLHISCSSMAGFQFAPARVSNKWLSEDYVKSDGLGGNKVSWPLDWQEPENTMVPVQPASEQPKDADMVFEIPQVVFTVSFDPPVILPHADWTRLYNFTESQPPPMPPRPPTFAQLFFPETAGVAPDPSEHRTFKRRRLLTTYDKDGQPTEKMHNNSLYVYKQIYSMQVSEMAFSHPKQLIAMLPLLRQWAFTSSLIHNSFGPKTELPPESAGSGVRFTREDLKKMPPREGLATIMGSNEENHQTATEDVETKIDVIVWVHPTPHFQVTFPFKDNKANIMLGVLENGTVEIISENIVAALSNGKVDGKEITKATLAKALEYMEDLCKWVEWIRSRLL